MADSGTFLPFERSNELHFDYDTTYEADSQYQKLFSTLLKEAHKVKR